jgi:hypothetical protein
MCSDEEAAAAVADMEDVLHAAAGAKAGKKAAAKASPTAKGAKWKAKSKAKSKAKACGPKASAKPKAKAAPPIGGKDRYTRWAGSLLIGFLTSIDVDRCFVTPSCVRACVVFSHALAWQRAHISELALVKPCSL